jgi:6-phosphogluconolactonase
VTSRFIYGTPGFEATGIQAAVINANGTVSPVAGAPFPEGMGTPSIIEIIADAHGRFIYVLNVEASATGILIGNPGICGFAIDHATGTLTRVPGSPIVFPVRNDNMIALDGTAHFLFEGNLANTGFDAYAIDQSSGALTRTLSHSNAAPVGTFAVASVDGRFLFSAGNGRVGTFSIDSKTGDLTLVGGTAVSAGGSAGPMATTTDGKFLYVANKTEGTLMIFAVAGNGSLTAAPGSPFAIDPRAQFLALTQDGKFLYVASASSNAIVKGYAVNPSLGTFTPVAGAVVMNAESITIDASGRLAYVSVFAPPGPGELVVYRIDDATGAFVQVAAQPSAPFSDDANDVVTVP